MSTRRLALLAVVVVAVALVGCSSGAPVQTAPDASAPEASASSLVIRATGLPALRGVTDLHERAARIRAAQAKPSPRFKLEMDGTVAHFGRLGLSLDDAPAVTSRSGQRSRVELRRGPNLTEWYQAGPLGLEQGFDVSKGGKQIVLRVAVSGATPAQAGDREIALLGASHRILARYGEAYAFDAKGRMLDVKLVALDSGIEIRVAAGNAVYPVEIDPMTWLTQAQLTPSDPSLGVYYGSSVALSGDTALVGASQMNSKIGAAYVFVRSGNTWTQQQKLAGSDSNGYFGTALALSGDTALVGAEGANSGVGAAYVYVRSGTTWTQQQKLLASDGAANDNFGISTALAGNTALVGADNKLSHTGAAYVFVRTGTTWTQQQKLMASDAAINAYFGASSALSGNTALVGAGHYSLQAGAAYVFVRSGTTWTQQQKLVASDSAAGNFFGRSAALSTDTALVGADGTNNGTGAAYVFLRSGTTWTQQQKLVASNGAAGDNLGSSAALSGDTALVGATGANSSKGAAYAYVRTGTTWTEQQKLVAFNGVANDAFGQSAALDGNTALVGEMGAGFAYGGAYVFVLSNPFANGTACPLDGPGACTSGICANGYCCDSACNQPCQTCNATPGTCTTVKNADDPDTCTGANTCGPTGACGKKDGQTCSADSECASTHCADGYCCNSACNGGCNVCNATKGTCTVVATGSPGAGPSCSPYVCSGAASCPTSCTSDSNCAAGYYCNASGQCVAQKAQAAACDDSAGKDCKTAGCRVCAGGAGHCADGVCCDTTCKGLCMACVAKWKQSGTGDGVCGPVKDDTNPRGDNCPDDGAASCGHDGMCDGAGGCRLYYPAGVSCGSSTCSGNKATGEICNGSGTCTTDVNGVDCAPFVCAAGSCTTSCTTSGDCTSGAWCNAGVCENKNKNGTACTGKDSCISGICVDGVCCNAPCNGQCEACDVTGGQGTCVPVSGKPRGTRPACPTGTASDPCSAAQCDGTNRTTCAGYVGSSVSCRKAACQGNQSIPAAVCDGKGQCPAAAPVDCGAYKCDTTTGQCKTACASTDDCVNGGRCQSGKCVSGSTCKDSTTMLDPAGKTTDCSPYACSGGACLQKCTSSSQCASGFVCDPAQKSCVATQGGGNNASNPAGCGCRAAGSPTRRELPIAGLLLLGALAVERRRKRLRNS